jgi:hypothetical protein
MIITIEFNHSSSPQFRFALTEAQLQPSFRESVRLYSVSYGPEDHEPMHKLLDLLRHFKYKRVYIDGSEKPWDEVFHYLCCYRLRQRAYKVDEYCAGDACQFPAFNPWGCIQTRMPLSADSEWLRYGRFDADGTWIFDKDKIKHYLIANTQDFKYCPALNIDDLMTLLNAFPETANPQIDENWEYNTVVDRRVMVEISVSSESKIRRYVCGVRPSSPAAVKNIYQKVIDNLI